VRPKIQYLKYLKVILKSCCGIVGMFSLAGMHTWPNILTCKHYQLNFQHCWWLFLCFSEYGILIFTN